METLTREEFEKAAREYFLQFETPVSDAEIVWEWKRFQKGRSWFNAHLGEYHHE